MTAPVLVTCHTRSGEVLFIRTKDDFPTVPIYKAVVSNPNLPLCKEFLATTGIGELMITTTSDNINLTCFATSVFISYSDPYCMYDEYECYQTSRISITITNPHLQNLRLGGNLIADIVLTNALCPRLVDENTRNSIITLRDCTGITYRKG